MGSERRYQRNYSFWLQNGKVCRPQVNLPVSNWHSSNSEVISGRTWTKWAKSTFNDDPRFTLDFRDGLTRMAIYVCQENDLLFCEPQWLFFAPTMFFYIFNCDWSRCSMKRNKQPERHLDRWISVSSLVSMKSESGMRARKLLFFVQF